MMTSPSGHVELLQFILKVGHLHRKGDFVLYGIAVHFKYFCSVGFTCSHSYILTLSSLLLQSHFDLQSVNDINTV